MSSMKPLSHQVLASHVLAGRPANAEIHGKTTRQPAAAVRGGNWMLVTLVLLAIPAAAEAQFIFETNNDTITVMGYIGTNAVLTIPSAINGYPVTSIAAGAFFLSSTLTSVTIPDSVTSIGDDAFRYCVNLASVTMGSSVTDIGAAAFNGCTSLPIVRIPSSVTNLGAGPFSDCPSLSGIVVEPGNSVYCDLDGCSSTAA
jgi:hypothetical protein